MAETFMGCVMLKRNKLWDLSVAALLALITLTPLMTKKYEGPAGD